MWFIFHCLRSISYYFELFVYYLSIIFPFFSPKLFFYYFSIIFLLFSYYFPIIFLFITIFLHHFNHFFNYFPIIFHYLSIILDYLFLKQYFHHHHHTHQLYYIWVKRQEFCFGDNLEWLAGGEVMAGASPRAINKGSLQF